MIYPTSVYRQTDLELSEWKKKQALNYVRLGNTGKFSSKLTNSFMLV